VRAAVTAALLAMLGAAVALVLLESAGRLHVGFLGQ